MAGRGVLLTVLVVFGLAGFVASLPFGDVIQQVTDGVRVDGSVEQFAHALLGAEKQFESFIKEFGKVYHTVEEYEHRFKVFKSNLLRALKHQALDPTASHGVTMFSDLTEEEFTTQYLGLKRPSALSTAPTAEPLPTGDLPPSFDWREKGAVGPVKNQGSCGSCWAFSTTGAVEGAHFLATGKLLSLSEQQLVDCDHQCDPEEAQACDAGCGGGLMTNAYKYVEEAGGLELESDYPYKGRDGKCQFNPNKVAAKVSNFTNIPIDEDQVAAYLIKSGPLAIAINAEFMQTYVAGVSCPIFCNKRNLDHGVLLVGYAEHGFAPARLAYKPYWIIKNSWGPMWGAKGYYKICRGHGECGLNTMVSAVSVNVDV
jgi:cathepsin F